MLGVSLRCLLGKGDKCDGGETTDNFQCQAEEHGFNPFERKISHSF